MPRPIISVLSSEFLATALPTGCHAFGDFTVTDGPEPDDLDFILLGRGDSIEFASYGRRESVPREQVTRS